MYGNSCVDILPGLVVMVVVDGTQLVARFTCNIMSRPVPSCPNLDIMLQLIHWNCDIRKKLNYQKNNGACNIKY